MNHSAATGLSPRLACGPLNTTQYYIYCKSQYVERRSIHINLSLFIKSHITWCIVTLNTELHPHRANNNVPNFKLKNGTLFSSLSHRRILKRKNNALDLQRDTFNSCTTSVWKKKLNSTTHLLCLSLSLSLSLRSHLQACSTLTTTKHSPVYVPSQQHQHIQFTVS